ncbi:MAG: 1-deoxy-D-xylulose-5-phosphate synthase [Kiritimatiellae bacterium]|nr:1-deoxy-D-xylulose-5-phosphate synthase [Kiritimatiellia bacterium]MDD5520659.1 1-deoxy-D-xylulose-5-phosphate synthase [Kiritimatiellia bacterium]
MSTVLDKVNLPDDIKKLSLGELYLLAAEVRMMIIDSVSKTGGHLAANLGVVELTVALLRLFDPPVDKIVWDVGHQTYGYKILTGRKDRFDSLRQFGGISGFPRRDESIFDSFGTGHSGTALSSALGMAAARDRVGASNHVIAVLGDGAVCCGISLEAFNNLAHTTKRLIVILNDNEMSIAANVGSMSRYLGELLANPQYNRWKRSVESFATKLKMGWLRSAYYKLEESIKGFFLRSVIFEEFGLRYIGPIDGHNIHALLDAMMIAKDSDRPILLHVSTRKGKGYAFAEQSPEKWHGTPGFDIESGEPLSVSKFPTYSMVLGNVLQRLADQDKRIIAITAAMASGTGLSRYAERFPNRFFDVGISEEHAVVFAAGLAAEGFVPVVAIYSTFFQRAIDCVIHDVCLQNLPVIFCLDRAGVVGDDGPTHHGVFDIALLRPIPGLIFMQPKDEAEFANMLYTAVRLGRPVAIRYPRGVGTGKPILPGFNEIPVGSAEVIREGKEVQVWALGDMISLAEKASDLLKEKGISAGVVNPRFIRPLDVELIESQAKTCKVFVTIENGVASSGFGSGIEEVLISYGYSGRVLKFGWPDEFIPQGKSNLLMEKYGLTPDEIANFIANSLAIAVAKEHKK